MCDLTYLERAFDKKYTDTACRYVQKIFRTTRDLNTITIH